MTAKAAMKADCSSSRSVPPMITPQPQQHNNNDDGNKKNDGSQRAKMAVSRAALTATVAVGKAAVAVVAAAAAVLAVVAVVVVSVIAAVLHCTRLANVRGVRRLEAAPCCMAPKAPNRALPDRKYWHSNPCTVQHLSVLQRGCTPSTPSAKVTAVPFAETWVMEFVLSSDWVCITEGLDIGPDIEDRRHLHAPGGGVAMHPVTASRVHMMSR